MKRHHRGLSYASAFGPTLWSKRAFLKKTFISETNVTDSIVLCGGGERGPPLRTHPQKGLTDVH